MMPLLVGLDMLWRQLERLEHEHRPEALRRPGYKYCDDFDDLEARTGRVQRLRSVLFLSGVQAQSILAERLAGINLSGVLRILVDACKDVALYWGGSVLAGGALGGAVGVFGGGVGALPGAVVGAGLGSQVGAWVLGLLGLKALLEDLGTALPEALGHYERGIRLAWGPVRHWEGTDGAFMDQIQASREIARGHVVLMMALLSALLAYLTRGRGDPAAKARILQEIRESRRLGPKVADWVAANEEALARHPGLKPKEQKVVMMSEAKPPAAPSMTPSQLRKAAEGESVPPPAKPPSTPEPPPHQGPVRPSGKVPLSGADRAVIDRRKVTDYALNPEHPVGGNKAKVFESALGFKKENADDLIAQLKDGVKNNPAVEGKLDQFGQRYTVDIPVTGPTGNGVVRTGWIYKVGSEVPELTTLFVK